VTIIEARYYSPDEYAKFAPAKKQKHFQLMRATKNAKSPAKTSSTSATMAELTPLLALSPQLLQPSLSSLLQAPSVLPLIVK
jgi:hypothetical protein